MNGKIILGGVVIFSVGGLLGGLLGAIRERKRLKDTMEILTEERDYYCHQYVMALKEKRNLKREVERLQKEEVDNYFANNVAATKEGQKEIVPIIVPTTESTEQSPSEKSDIEMIPLKEFGKKSGYDAISIRLYENGSVTFSDGALSHYGEPATDFLGPWWTGLRDAVISGEKAEDVCVRNNMTHTDIYIKVIKFDEEIEDDEDVEDEPIIDQSPLEDVDYEIIPLEEFGSEATYDTIDLWLYSNGVLTFSDGELEKNGEVPVEYFGTWWADLRDSIIKNMKYPPDDICIRNHSISTDIYITVYHKPYVLEGQDE